MTVEELAGYLRKHWLEIRESLLNGSYRPQTGSPQGDPEAGRWRPRVRDSDSVGPSDPASASPSPPG